MHTKATVSRLRKRNAYKNNEGGTDASAPDSTSQPGVKVSEK